MVWLVPKTPNATAVIARTASAVRVAIAARQLRIVLKATIRGAICDNPSFCQGHLGEKACNDRNQCFTRMSENDSACDATVEQDCGYFAGHACNGRCRTRSLHLRGSLHECGGLFRKCAMCRGDRCREWTDGERLYGQLSLVYLRLWHVRLDVDGRQRSLHVPGRFRLRRRRQPVQRIPGMHQQCLCPIRKRTSWFATIRRKWTTLAPNMNATRKPVLANGNTSTDLSVTMASPVPRAKRVNRAGASRKTVTIVSAKASWIAPSWRK